MKVEWRKAGRLLGRGLAGLLSLAMLAGLYFTLIIGQPQPKEQEDTPVQPALTASPAMQIDQEGELRDLVAAFPAPVMSFMSGSGMIFVSGTSADTAWKGQFGRVATLYWQTAAGEPLILQSIYPSTALSALEDGYRFSSTGGPMLFGSQSVRMEKADTVRIHAAADTGLYVMIVPKSLGSQVAALSRSLQIISYPD